MAGQHEVAVRAASVAAGDLAGWGGFATVLAALLALAAGSGWAAALMLICLGSLATAALCWAAGPAGTASVGSESTAPNGAGEPSVTA